MGGGSGVFRVKLNDNDLSTDAITISETSYTPADPLPDGAATLYIQERDEAGNWSGTASGNAEVDTTAPAPVGNLTAETEVGAVTLTWDDPPDADGDLHEIVITWTPVEGDPQPKSIPIGTGSATISGLTNVADYTFTVSAVDTLGNAASETVTAVVALGLVKWSASAGENFFGGSSLAPDGTIYVADLSGVVYAFHQDDGSELEQWDLGLGVQTAPAIAGDGTIYVAAGPTDSGTLFALNSNGTIDSSYDIDAPLVTSPAIASDGTVYLAAGDGNVYVFNPDLTLVDTLSTEATRIESSPSIGNDGTVYVGADDGKVYAFNADPAGEWPFSAADQIHSAPAIAADGTVYVATFDNTITAGDSGLVNFLYAINPDGTLQWELSLPDPVDSSPVLGPDGTIYLSMWGGDLFAVDPSGDVKWTFPDGTFPTGTRNSTPAVGVDGTVYVGMDGVYAVNPDGSLKWRYQPSASFGSFDSPILIGEDGTVYAGNFDKTFFAIYGSSGGPADSPWPMFGQNARRTGLAP